MVRPSSLIDSADQRALATLLLLPFFLLAFALGMSQTWRHPIRIAAPAAPALPGSELPPTVVVGPVGSAATPEITLAPALRVPGTPPLIEVPDLSLAAPTIRLPAEPPEVVAAVPVLPTPILALPLLPPVVDLPTPFVTLPQLTLAALAPMIAAPELSIARSALRVPDGPPQFEPPPEPQREARLSPIVPPGAAEVPKVPELAVCPVIPGFGRHTYEVRAVTFGEDFGVRLAEAARAQIGPLVIYNDRYQRIVYPMGDVSPMFGVCTDVVIRAYRALGIDLQELVAKARVGSGDTSIQHRRVETLRRFLATRGQSLPITTFPENYQPGDVVTYHRPQNSRSRSHIAIVSDVIAPSGRPMIVHNRGWGPQIEDALFVDQITGHYRFRPVTAAKVAAQPPVKSSAQSVATRKVVKADYAPAPLPVAQPVRSGLPGSRQ